MSGASKAFLKGSSKWQKLVKSLDSPESLAPGEGLATYDKIKSLEKKQYKRHSLIPKSPKREKARLKQRVHKDRINIKDPGARNYVARAHKIQRNNIKRIGHMGYNKEDIT